MLTKIVVILILSLGGFWFARSGLMSFFALYLNLHYEADPKEGRYAKQYARDAVKASLKFAFSVLFFMLALSAAVLQ